VTAKLAFAPLRPEDFRLFEPQNRSDEGLNERRLGVRRKLQSIGEAAHEALRADGLALERRESLHHPFAMNHFRVVAQWTALFRDAKARRELARRIGPELGKGLDPAHANASLAVSVDDEGVELGFRVGVEAWYDGQNLAKRCATDAARRELAALLRSIPGFALRIHDWAKTYPTEKASREDLEELVRYYQPGQHRLSCFRSIAKGDPRATSPELRDEAVAALRSLAPLYRFAVWSPENDLLLRAGGGFTPSS